MKQFLLSMAAFLLMASMSFGQSADLHNFIDKYKNESGFSYAFLSKEMFEVAVESDIKTSDWKKLHQVVRNIGSLSILSADSLNEAIAYYKEALAAVPNTEFDELLTVQDGKDRVRIWIRNEEAVLTDLVLLVGTADEFVLVCFNGNLELNNLAELATLFDAESAEQLAKTSQAVAADFSISPNPNSGTFTLNYIYPDDLPDQLSVMDMNGKLLVTRNLTGDPTQQVTLRGLPNGVYWVQLKTKKGRIGAKQMQILVGP